MIKELLLVILGAVLADNLILSGYFGFDSAVMGKDRKTLALSVAIVLVLSALLCKLLGSVLVSLGLEYMFIMLYAVVVLLCALIPGYVFGDKTPSYGVLVLNGAVLAAAVKAAEMSVAEGLCYALGTAVAFWGLMEIFASLRLKLNDPSVPKAMRGTPVTVLAAGIIAMAIYAF